MTDRALATLAAAGRLHAYAGAYAEDEKRATRAEEVVQFHAGKAGKVIGRQLTDDGVKHLAVFTNLKWLDLGVISFGFERGRTVRLTDACLKNIAGFRQLERLASL